MADLSNILIVTDLDGTFLNSKGEISKASAQMISDLAKKGVLFTVATARTHATVMHMFRDIPLTCPLVLMNGVTLYNPAEKKIISCNAIPTELGKRIVKELRDRNIDPMLYFQNGDSLDIFPMIIRGSMLNSELIAQANGLLKLIHLST